MLQQAKDVPMLDMFGGENWTPNLNHPGLFKRAGIDHWAVYRWDPKAKDRRVRRQLRRDVARSASTRRCAVRPFGGLAVLTAAETGPVTVQSFLQFLIIGLGAGATYALFAQGAVLIYRGSGLVNFAQGAIGTFAAYIAFVDLKGDQRLGDASRARRRGDRGRRGVARVPGDGPPRVAARGADRSGHRDDRAPRSPPSRRR